MSFLLTCDQMGPTLGNGGDQSRSHLCPWLSLYRMMQGIIVGGVTWESCRARVSPSCASLRKVFLGVPLGWEEKGLEGHLPCPLVSILHLWPELYVSIGHVSWCEAQLERDSGLGCL